MLSKFLLLEKEGKRASRGEWLKLGENFDGEEEEREERRVAEELRAAIGAITPTKGHQELIRLILEFRTTLRFPTSLGLWFWASFSIIINLGHVFLKMGRRLLRFLSPFGNA